MTTIDSSTVIEFIIAPETNYQITPFPSEPVKCVLVVCIGGTEPILFENKYTIHYRETPPSPITTGRIARTSPLKDLHLHLLLS